MVALVAEYGNTLVVQAKYQRVADLAAYSGALAFTATSSETRMREAAQAVAALNGIPAADVTVSLVNSPRDATKRAVHAIVEVTNELFLAPLIGAPGTIDVAAAASAQIGGSTDSCILALDAAGTGVTLSGGVSITASTCAVASNNKVQAPCGTRITAKQVSYGTALNQPGCTTVTADTIIQATTADPIAGNAGVATATARVATVTAMTAPVAPTGPTIATYANIDFAWNQSATTTRATAAGCTATWSQPNWTMTCPSGGIYNFGNLTLGGGINLYFNTAGTATTTYNFSGNITTSATVQFGPGTYNVAGNITTAGTTTFGAGTYRVGGSITFNGTNTLGAGSYSVVRGITTGGGSNTTFGAGTFHFGRSTTSCSGQYYSICNTATLTFGGPSTFTLNSGIYNGGGATITLGSDTTNSYVFGPSSNGDAIFMGGGAKTYMRDATGPSSVFQMVGNINAASGGGSCLIIPAASQHDIKGYLNVSGAMIMGAGVYTIDGYYALGAGSGGGATCTGYAKQVMGDGVTIVVSGLSAPSSGSCSGQAFCVAAGYSNIQLTAPTSGTTAKLAVIGPQSSTNTRGATFSEGASGGQVSGLFYFPWGPITMSGGAGLSGGSNCLQLVGSQVTMSGGTTLASTCISGSGGASASPTLVQ